MWVVSVVNDIGRTFIGLSHTASTFRWSHSDYPFCFALLIIDFVLRVTYSNHRLIKWSLVTRPIMRTSLGQRSNFWCWSLKGSTNFVGVTRSAVPCTILYIIWMLTFRWAESLENIQSTVNSWINVDKIFLAAFSPAFLEFSLIAIATLNTIASVLPRFQI